MGGWLLLLTFGVCFLEPLREKWRLGPNDCPMLYGGARGTAQHSLTLFSFSKKCFWKSSMRSRDTPSIRTWTRSRSPRRSSGGNKTRYVACPRGHLCQVPRPLRKSGRPLGKPAGGLVSDSRKRGTTLGQCQCLRQIVL